MNWTGLVAFYHSDDLEATHHFYHDVLGLPLYKDQGACRIYEVLGGGYIGFCEHFPEARPEGLIITLLTDAVDEAYERVRAVAESTVEASPQENPRFRIYHFFLRDPNGYKVEIQTFLE